MMSILVSILFYTVTEHSVMVSSRGCPGSTCISLCGWKGVNSPVPSTLCCDMQAELMLPAIWLLCTSSRPHRLPQVGLLL